MQPCKSGSLCPTSAPITIRNNEESCSTIAGSPSFIADIYVDNFLQPACPGSSSNTPCPQGSYCPDSTTQVVCPTGHYCPQGSSKSIACDFKTDKCGLGEAANPSVIFSIILITIGIALTHFFLTKFVHPSGWLYPSPPKQQEAALTKGEARPVLEAVSIYHARVWHNGKLSFAVPAVSHGQTIQCLQIPPGLTALVGVSAVANLPSSKLLHLPKMVHQHSIAA